LFPLEKFKYFSSHLSDTNGFIASKYFMTADGKKRADHKDPRMAFVAFLASLSSGGVVRRAIERFFHFVRALLFYSANASKLNDFIIQSAMVCSINGECRNGGVRSSAQND
jgi:hypothetical protein